MASSPPAAEDGRRGRRRRARRRLGFSLGISAASMAAGGGCLAAGRLAHLSIHMHLSLPHDALYLLIITAGIVAIILGCRVIVYLERRDQHRHDIMAGMQHQEGVYQEYEDSFSAYVRWPATTATQSEQSLRRPRRSRPAGGNTRHGDVVPLDRHPQIGPGTRPEGGTSHPDSGQPGAAGEGPSRVVRALPDPQPTTPQLPTRPGAGRSRSRRRS